MDNIEQKYKMLYDKLFKLLSNIESINADQWSTLHILAYVMKKYKEKFDSEFILSYDNVPSKCHEYRLLSRLQSMLNKKEEIKNYINWFFENYQSKTKFRSVAAIVKVDNIIKYNEYKETKTKITIYTELPNNIIEIAKKYKGIEYIKTYGDLYFLYKSDEESINPLLAYINIEELKKL